MSTWVYISGPLSQGDPLDNIRLAIDYWVKCRALGTIPICPHLSYYIEKQHPNLASHSFWLMYDKEVLERCDVMIRLHHLPSLGADYESKVFAGPIFQVPEEWEAFKGWVRSQ